MWKEKRPKSCKSVSVQTETWPQGPRHRNLNVHLLSSGRSLPGFNHGVPSSAPALHSPALLWTLQTSQPGPLPGWSGGESLRRHQNTQTHHNLVASSRSLRPSMFEPHMHPSLIIAAATQHTSWRDTPGALLSSLWQQVQALGPDQLSIFVDGLGFICNACNLALMKVLRRQLSVDAVLQEKDFSLLAWRNSPEPSHLRAMGFVWQCAYLFLADFLFA